MRKVYLGNTQIAITPEGNQDINTLNEVDVSEKATARISAAERAKIIPENIKKDVEILGVTGTYEGSITPAKLEKPSFYNTNLANGRNRRVVIENNSLNGKFETTHTLYNNNGTFISDIDSLGSSADDDNAFAARVGLTTGNYYITAKNPLPVFEESDPTYSLNVLVTDLAFDLTHLTLSGTIPSKIINWSDIEFAIVPESGDYVRPNSVIVQLADLRAYTLPGDGSVINISGSSSASASIAGWYDSTTGHIGFNTIIPTNITSLKIIAAAEVAQTGHTVTIYLDGSFFEYTMSSNTLTVDSVSYSVNGGIGSIETDYPDNGTQITASEVSISGDCFRWKDSDTSSWQENVGKTWTIPRDNFKIWIEVAMDE